MFVVKLNKMKNAILQWRYYGRQP